MKRMTVEQANRRCAYWQKRLNISDWHVKVKIVRSAKMSHGSSMGEVDIFDQKSMAIVKLLDPIDWDGTPMIPKQDMELTLVHELLHIRLYNVNTRSVVKTSVVLEEQAINALAWALAGTV